MFDGLKGFGGLASVMKDLPRIKAKMQDVKDRLAEVEVEAETGGGAVSAVANGHMRVVKVRIDPALLAGLVDADDPADRAMAEDLIQGAVNAALAKAREAAEQEFAAAAEELGLPIPPDAMGGLLK